MTIIWLPEKKFWIWGCGNGRYFPFFKEKKVNYFGIDNSKELIKIAKEKFPEAKLEKGDALNLPFVDNFFDKVYSIALLHHLPSKEFRLQFLSEVKRVLKPQGLVVLTVWKFWTIESYLLILKYTILKLIGRSKLDWKDFFEPWGKKVKRYYHWFSEKEMVDLLKKSGFKVKRSGLVKNIRGNRRNIYIVAENLS